MTFTMYRCETCNRHDISDPGEHEDRYHNGLQTCFHVAIRTDSANDEYQMNRLNRR